LNYMTLLASANGSMQQNAAVTGVAAFAQSAIGNPSFDIAGAYSAMSTAIGNVNSWLHTNFPASGGFLQAVSFNTDGSQAARVFSAATLSGYITQLQALAATIA